MLAAGKDATEDFEEIGHSNSAREMLDKYEIGKFEVRLLNCGTVCLLRSSDELALHANSI